MLKNRRSATPTKDKLPSAGGDAAPGSRKTSSSSLTFFNRGPNRSSLNSDRFNANRSADGAFAASVPHWSDQGRRLSLSHILARELILADFFLYLVHSLKGYNYQLTTGTDGTESDSSPSKFAIAREW